MILFFKVFLTEFIAEMGDKTQLMLIALTSKYKLRDIILGTAAAILVLNGLAVLAGGLVSEFIPAWLIKIIAAFAFLYFAASTLAGDDDEEEEGSGRSRIRFAPLAVFFTFFVAELGDKTQLTAITFGANEGMSSALIVWLGCSLGLFLADILGMLLGYLLKSKTPEGLLNTLAFVIFSVFGVFTLYQGLKLISTDIRSIPVLPILIAAMIAFAGICVHLFLKKEKKHGEQTKNGSPILCLFPGIPCLAVLVSLAHFSGVISAGGDSVCLFLRDQLRGLDNIYTAVICLAYPDLALEVAVLLAISHAVIMPAVSAEPFDLLAQVTMAEITFAGHDFLICEGFCLVLEFPGNIFYIGIKLRFNLIPTVLRRTEGIVGQVHHYLRVLLQDPDQDLCRIVGITERPVEGNILLNMQKIDGIFQISADLALLIGNGEQLLHIQIGQRSRCQKRHLIICHVPL